MKRHWLSQWHAPTVARRAFPGAGPLRRIARGKFVAVIS
jgi:hypothetical protein